MRAPGARLATGLALQAAGWLLVVVGVAALALPGPGLLTLFAGVAVLSTRYRWAQRRLAPLRDAAMHTAAESVATSWRTAMSVLGATSLLVAGAGWTLQPSTPGWWSLDPEWWLPGGLAVGLSLIASGLIAAATTAFAHRAIRANQPGEAPFVVTHT